MRVLLTGASGYLGGRIAARLAEGGHVVRGLVRDRARWSDPPPGSEIAIGDVTDRAALAQAARGCDAIVHAAAFVKVWARDRSTFDRVNVEAFREVSDLAHASAHRLVYVSSFIALGPTDGAVFTEDTPRASTRPANDYERTKWAADVLARRLAAVGRDLVRVYPGVVYGPGTLTAGNHVVGALLQHARGRLPGMLGPGDRRQCFAYVEDVAAGVVMALERGGAGSGYILGGENRTARELFAAFAAATGIAPPRRHIPYGVAALVGRWQRWRAELTGREPELTDEVVEVYRHEWAYSSARAERELGYRITPFDEGIRRTAEWMRTTGLIGAGEGQR